MADTVFLPNAVSFPLAAENWAKEAGVLDPSGTPTIPTVPANKVTYSGETIDTAVNKLKYTRIAIDSMTVTPAVVEQGATTSVTVSWTLTGTPTSQTVNGVSVPAGNRTTTVSGINAQTTITLSVTDNVDPNGTSTKTKASVVTVTRRRYWGLSTSTSLNSAAIIALSNSEISDIRAKSFKLTAPGSPGSYIYYAYPESLGDPSNYRIFGFEDTPVRTTVSVTTGTGAILNYIVLRSANPLIGDVTVEVV